MNDDSGYAMCSNMLDVLENLELIHWTTWCDMYDDLCEYWVW